MWPHRHPIREKLGLPFFFAVHTSKHKFGGKPLILFPLVLVSSFSCATLMCICKHLLLIPHKPKIAP